MIAQYCGKLTNHSSVLWPANQSVLSITVTWPAAQQAEQGGGGCVEARGEGGVPGVAVRQLRVGGHHQRQVHTWKPQIEMDYFHFSLLYKRTAATTSWLIRNATLMEIMRTRFQCPECDYKATQNGDLQRQIKSIHIGETFPCPDCDYKATQKSHLVRHIRSIHKGVTFSCKECDYKARQRSHLKTHIISIHRGETYQCPNCSYKTTWKDSLQKHIKSIHRGET